MPPTPAKCYNKPQGRKSQKPNKRSKTKNEKANRHIPHKFATIRKAVLRSPLNLKKKLYNTALIALAIFTLALTACKDEPDSTDNKDNTPPPKPIEVTFNIPAEYANLNKTKPITILFPATFTTARMDNIKNKFIGAMNGLNIQAEDNNFKAKINAILDRGLTITIEETNSLSYGMKVVNNQLVAETSYLENAGVTSGHIASRIINLIDNGILIAQ